jgi:choline transport protein
MNYCIVAFAIIIIISTFQWFIDGRKNYSGPKLDVEAMREGEVLGMAVESHENGVRGGVAGVNGHGNGTGVVNGSGRDEEKAGEKAGEKDK